MKTISILLLALVPAFAGAQSQRAVFLQGEGRDNIMQKWEVARDKWQAQPKWTPASNGPPPLTIAKAVEAGETWLRKRHPDLKKLVVSQVTLKAQGTNKPTTPVSAGDLKEALRALAGGSAPAPEKIEIANLEQLADHLHP